MVEECLHQRIVINLTAGEIDRVYNVPRDLSMLGDDVLRQRVVGPSE